MSGRQAVGADERTLWQRKNNNFSINKNIPMVGPLAYLGGKNRVARRIISLFPEHTCYIEPFCGGAQVFFHKEPSKVELLNDLNEQVINFLRICQMHYEELVRYLRYCVV